MKLAKLLGARLSTIKNPDILNILNSIDGLKYGREAYGIFDPSKSVFLGNSVPVHTVLEAMSRRRVQHFVQTSGNSVYLPSLAVAGAMMLVAGRFLNEPVAFFFPTIYSVDGASSLMRKMTIPFRSSKDREAVLKHVREYIVGDKLTKPLESTANILVDELLTNALQAPIDENGRRIFEKGVTNPQELTLGQDKLGHITLAHDEDRLLISAKDPCGSLDPEKLWSSLTEAFDPGSEELGIPNDTQLGMKLIVDNCSEFAIVSKKNIMTSVNCSIILGVSGRDRSQMPKSLHFKFF